MGLMMEIMILWLFLTILEVPNKYAYTIGIRLGMSGPELQYTQAQTTIVLIPQTTKSMLQ